MNTEMFWKTEKRKISDLIKFQRNPRRLTERQKEDLKKSITKFNLVEIPAINTDNTLLAGHQRLSILQEIQGDIEIDVRVPSRALTEDEVKEYVVRSNKNTGEWDYGILEEVFSQDELSEWGFDYEGLNVDESFIDSLDETSIRDITISESDSFSSTFVIPIEFKDSFEQLGKEVILDAIILKLKAGELNA